MNSPLVNSLTPLDTVQTFPGNRVDIYQSHAHLVVDKKPRLGPAIQYAVWIDLEDVAKVRQLKWVASNSSQRYVYFRAMHGSMIKAGIPLGNSMLHRYLIDAPDGYHVDHINHNTLDNRKENLRVVTHLANNLNREDLVGSIPQRGDKFLPSITYRGRTYHLGTFDDFSHAAAARVAAKKLILQIDQDLRDGQYECC